jgi:hypothetical protein
MLKRISKEEEEDLNIRAKEIVSQATWGEVELKNPAAVELGRLGGLKGGKARAERLSPERRKEIAREAARARWKKERKS